MKKNKAFYLVTVLTPIKDGNQYTASARIFDNKVDADTHAAYFSDDTYIVKVEKRLLPQH